MPALATFSILASKKERKKKKKKTWLGLEGWKAEKGRLRRLFPVEEKLIKSSVLSL